MKFSADFDHLGRNFTAGSISEMENDFHFRRTLICFTSCALISVLVLYTNDFRRPSFSSDLSSPQEENDFINNDPSNGAVLLDGSWFWPAQGVGTECNVCMKDILKKRHPWILNEKSHPEDALSCVFYKDCRKASTDALIRALGGGGTTSITMRLFSSRNAIKESPEQLMYSANALDRRQYDLNWQKAQLFARHFGNPASQHPPPIVLTEWTPPLDPVGRPVPSWLTFRPVDLPPWLQSPSPPLQQLTQDDGSSGGSASSSGTQSPPQPQQQQSAHAVCVMQGGCDGCVAAGFHWCGTQVWRHLLTFCINVLRIHFNSTMPLNEVSIRALLCPRRPG
jgi:hypothetical protein